MTATMPFLAVKRRHFLSRYRVVGRSQLGILAEITGITLETATEWADADDAETAELTERYARRVARAAGDASALPTQASPVMAGAA